MRVKLLLFYYQSIRTCVLGAQTNRHIETVLLSTHYICFGWEIKKIVFQYTLLSEGLFICEFLSNVLTFNHFNWVNNWPEVIELFACPTQLSMKFQLVMKTQMLKYKNFSCFQTLRCCIYHAYKINVKMPTSVGILTLMSMINFMLTWVEH